MKWTYRLYHPPAGGLGDAVASLEGVPPMVFDCLQIRNESSPTVVDARDTTLLRPSSRAIRRGMTAQRAVQFHRALR